MYYDTFKPGDLLQFICVDNKLRPVSDVKHYSINTHSSASIITRFPADSKFIYLTDSCVFYLQKQKLLYNTWHFTVTNGILCCDYRVELRKVI